MFLWVLGMSLCLLRLLPAFLRLLGDLMLRGALRFVTACIAAQRMNLLVLLPLTKPRGLGGVPLHLTFCERQQAPLVCASGDLELPTLSVGRRFRRR